MRSIRVCARFVCLGLLLGTSCMPSRVPLPADAPFEVVGYGVAHGVEVVVLLWGTNEVYAPGYDRDGSTQGRDALVAKTGRSLDQLLAAGLRPVVVFPPPSLDPHPEGTLANLRLADLEWAIALEAVARDVAFVSLYTRILDEPDPAAFFAEGGVQLNETGAAFVARQIESVVAPLHAAL